MGLELTSSDSLVWDLTTMPFSHFYYSSVVMDILRKKWFVFDRYGCSVVIWFWPMLLPSWCLWHLKHQWSPSWSWHSMNRNNLHRIEVSATIAMVTKDMHRWWCASYDSFDIMYGNLLLWCCDVDLWFELFAIYWSTWSFISHLSRAGKLAWKT